MSRSPAAAGARVGFFGGTFDPVHSGHLQMAEAAQRACGLERIYFVPAPRPQHKMPPMAAYIDRYAMLALALERRPEWLPLNIPPTAARATYSVDQIDWMREHHAHEQVWFIAGADAFATLGSWRQYRKLLRLCNFAVLARRGYSLNRVLSMLPPGAVEAVPVQGPLRLAGGRRLHWLADFSVPDSSTRVRRWLAAAQPSAAGDELTPPAVAEYARRAGLYRTKRHHSESGQTASRLYYVQNH